MENPTLPHFSSQYKTNISIPNEVRITAESWVRATGVWYLITFCLGVPLNLWVLFTWFRFARRDSRRASRRCNKHWFIASMTFADLLNTAFYAPGIGIWFGLRITYGPTYCRILFSIAHVSALASSLSLLCLNVDKFMYLTCSLKYAQYVTKRRVIAATVAVWTLSIAWAVTFTTALIDMQDGCTYHPKSQYFLHFWYVIFSVIGFILPVALSLIINVHIAFIVARHVSSTRRSDQMLHGIQARNQAVVHTPGRQRGVTFKRTTFIFATTIWTAVTYLPYRFIIMLSSASYSPWRYFLCCTMAANPVGNPLITIFTMNAYSSPTWKFMRKCLCCRR